MKSSLRTFWQRLDGPVHPEDKPFFEKRDHSFNLDFPPPAFIGDIDHAPVIILMANGGYDASRTPEAFLDAQDCLEHLDYLAGRRKEFPKRFPDYYIRQQWVREGSAALVNAVAYRSSRIASEPLNRRLAQCLPSVLLHRRWLTEEVLPAVRDKSRMVIAHRPRLWNLDRKTLAEYSNFIFSTNPASPYLSKMVQGQVGEWLNRRR